MRAVFDVYGDMLAVASEVTPVFDWSIYGMCGHLIREFFNI